MRLFKRQKKNRDPQLAATPLNQQLPDLPADELEIIESVRPFTMTSPERIAALCSAVRHVCELDIPGDIVEGGVWKGGSMMAVAKTLANLGQPDRRLWLYDTFEGMTEPSERDVDFLGRDADSLLESEDRNDPSSIWCRSQLDQVKQAMATTAYDPALIEFVTGPVEETIPQYIPERISLLRLDTDWYESTKHELVHLMPRLSEGGILIIDDYGHWAGCRRAVDEYFREYKIRMFLNRIDYTGRIGVNVASGSPNAA